MGEPDTLASDAVECRSLYTIIAVGPRMDPGLIVGYGEEDIGPLFGRLGGHGKGQYGEDTRHAAGKRHMFDPFYVSMNEKWTFLIAPGVVRF